MIVFLLTKLRLLRDGVVFFNAPLFKVSPTDVRSKNPHIICGDRHRDCRFVQKIDQRPSFTRRTLCKFLALVCDLRHAEANL
jgi:hypothetical protein